VRDEAVPDRLPWEGLPSRELRPSPEFEAFLDERHARWKANLADPRHGEGFHGSGLLVTAEADDPGPPNRGDSSPHRPITPQPQVVSRPPVHVDRQESPDEHESATIELFRVVRYSSGQVEEWASEVDSEIAAGVLPAFRRDAAIDAKIDAYCIRNLRSTARWFTPEAVNTLDDSTHGNAVVQEWTSWGEARRTGTMAPHVMARQYKISVPPGEYLYVGATAPKGYRQSSDPERPTGSSYHSSLSGRELQVYFPPQSDRSGWLVSQVGFPALADASGSQSPDAEFAAALGAPRAEQRDKYLRGKPLIGGLAETSAFDLTDVVNDFSGVVYEVQVGIHGRHWSGEAVPSVSTPTTSRGGALTEA
jgi:hypothetical protein